MRESKKKSKKKNKNKTPDKDNNDSRKKIGIFFDLDGTLVAKADTNKLNTLNFSHLKKLNIENDYQFFTYDYVINFLNELKSKGFKLFLVSKGQSKEAFKQLVGSNKPFIHYLDEGFGIHDKAAYIKKKIKDYNLDKERSIFIDNDPNVIKEVEPKNVIGKCFRVDNLDEFKIKFGKDYVNDLKEYNNFVYRHFFNLISVNDIKEIKTKLNF